MPGFKYAVKVGVIAVIAVIVAKRLPVVRDFM